MKALVIGAGRGIGLEFTRQYLADSAYEKVFATFRQPSISLNQLAAAYPDKLVCLQVDVTKESEIEGAITALQQQTQSLNEVIYAVGLLHNEDMQPEKSLRHIQADNLVTYFQVNAIGAVLWTKYLFPFLRGSNPAIFAAISAKVGSIGDNGLGGWYGYRASKAALNMLLKNVSIEWRRKTPNVVVTMLHPGTTDTDLSKPFQKNVPEGKLFPPEKTVTLLRTVIANLTPDDNGAFFSWDGSRLPW